MPKARIRQHVNPLLRKFQEPIVLPEWQQVYTNPNLPLHFDIGCAKGEFLLKMAQRYPEQNFLGIEIRHPLVIKANATKAELGLTNLYYLFGSINYAASEILTSLPSKVLQCITVQFPDPWFKKKHNKRRVIQPELVNSLVDYLLPNGTIFLQSDIEEVAVEMSDRFAQNQSLVKQHTDTWLTENPLLVPTERELYVLKNNLPVYRTLYKKKLN